MNKVIEGLITKKLKKAGYDNDIVDTLVSYLVDAEDNQLDDGDYLQFLKIITGE